jgi:hypothetical protein
LVYFSFYPPSGIIFNSIHNYLEIMFPIDMLRFSEFRTMRNHLSETLMLNDIQITRDYMSRWVALKRRVEQSQVRGFLRYSSMLISCLRDFGLDKGGVDPFSPKYSCLVYVTWRPFVFSNQFDLNLFMIITDNSSIL